MTTTLLKSSDCTVNFQKVREDDSYWYDVWVEGPNGREHVNGFTSQLPTEDECYGIIGDYLNDSPDGHLESDYDERYEMSDVEADADTLVSAGFGTDEDYGCYGGEEW